MLFFSDLSFAVDFDFGLHNLPTLALPSFSTHFGAMNEAYQPATGLSLAIQVIAYTGYICMDSFTP